MQNLKEKTIRAGFARLCAFGICFLLRIFALMILVRLLTPKDFGLVGMVSAVTGILTWFRDFGLSSASVQRATITEEQFSTLFWINIAMGVLLTTITVAMAPVIARFYAEPELLWITAVLSAGFLFNAAGVQHSARLQREMRFTALAAISVISLYSGGQLLRC
jgi:O-antigen/teichoic acid export membrane protein